MVLQALTKTSSGFRLRETINNSGFVYNSLCFFIGFHINHDYTVNINYNNIIDTLAVRILSFLKIDGDKFLKDMQNFLAWSITKLISRNIAD